MADELDELLDLDSKPVAKQLIAGWRRGVVDLTILGVANAVDQIIHLNEEFLGDGGTVLPKGGSAAIPIDVPMVDRFAGFQAQIERFGPVCQRPPGSLSYPIR